MVAAADKHLTGLVEYNVPLGGMFLWMKVHLAPSSNRDFWGRGDICKTSVKLVRKQKAAGVERVVTQCKVQTSFPSSIFKTI